MTAMASAIPLIIWLGVPIAVLVVSPVLLVLVAVLVASPVPIMSAATSAILVIICLGGPVAVMSSVRFLS
jgi:hypothetical protein